MGDDISSPQTPRALGAGYFVARALCIVGHSAAPLASAPEVPVIPSLLSVGKASRHCPVSPGGGVRPTENHWLHVSV